MVPTASLGQDTATVSGASLYTDMCAACHGEDAVGATGPDIQGSTLKDVTQAIRGIDQMPEVFIEEKEAEAIAAYLMALNPEVAETKRRLETLRQK